jgi:hypothetical protein
MPSLLWYLSWQSLLKVIFLFLSNVAFCVVFILYTTFSTLFFHLVGLTFFPWGIVSPFQNLNLLSGIPYLWLNFPSHFSP